MDSEKLAVSTTTDGKPAREGFETAAAPAPVDPKTGMHQAYWVLNDEERGKGFVRPYRDQYQHVGSVGPVYPLRDLTEAEALRYEGVGYWKVEEYPADSALVCRFWTKKMLERTTITCRAITSMGRSIAETYARDPRYYGSTFCIECGAHFPVGPAGEFIWLDGERVGT